MNHEIYAQVFQTLGSQQPAVLYIQFHEGHGNAATLKKRLIPESDSAFQKALAHGYPILKTEGSCHTLLEPFFPEERLIVLGGGHIAQPLVDFASKTDFSVVVADDRPSFANTVRFPAAARIICDSFDNTIRNLRITASDFVVVITRGHRHDMACLEQLQQGPEPFYVGMIGSRRRVTALKQALVEKGCDPKRLNRTHTPIGLSIGAIKPAEIAVSILAEIIACKRLSRGGEAGGANRSDIDLNVLRLLAEERDVPKAIVTVISARGSVPRGPGAKMLVYEDRRIVGSIGGGCSESEVIRIAQQMIGTGQYQLHTVDLTAEIAEEEGMVCGGVMQVFIEDY